MILGRLRDARHHQALSMRELSRRSGVTQTTIVRAEKGEHVYPTTVRKLAKALGMPPSELWWDPFDQVQSPEPPPPPSKPDVSLALARALAEVEECRADGDDAGAARWEQIAAGIAQSAEVMS